ncbi:MAG: type II toxin-antitoxin system RelE/ParE family toxin [Proteobacteria bacterium]|nr:type II toxin-antitoxin system RelE/ParE family toxin [Pseudomonadota bacterium]
MNSFRILSQASEELEASVAYYNMQRAGLGTTFLSEFENTKRRIQELPLAARTLWDNLRQRPIHRFPYFVLYRISIDEITIVAVAHRRRIPGYWAGGK